MEISEAKVKIVINNYFPKECNINTTIREAFEKGFRLGLQKAIPAADVRPVVRAQWEQVMGKYDFLVRCNKCHYIPIDDLRNVNFCPGCGADMRGTE